MGLLRLHSIVWGFRDLGILFQKIVEVSETFKFRYGKKFIERVKGPMPQQFFLLRNLANKAINC